MVSRSTEALIHLVIFAILAIVIVFLLTALFGEYHKLQGCALNPDIWCWNDWKCDTAPDRDPEQIFGPAADYANSCNLGNDNVLSTCVCQWKPVDTSNQNLQEVCAEPTIVQL